MKCLNIGCGERFNSEWTNLDFVQSGNGVQAHDLRGGIPFQGSTFDVVYHSHVLEHFGKKEALNLLRECHRVLRPGGIIRVVVPDLERIAQLYLQALENIESAGDGAQAQYDWMLLELYDQTVREYPGGEMMEFAHKATVDEQEFLRQRLGGELDRMLKAKTSSQVADHSGHTNKMRGLVEVLRREVLRLVAGREGMKSYDLGRFRNSGEVHRWMYDRYSLGRTLKAAGFTDPRRVGVAESAIPEWTNFHLDTETDGQSYKPDSLYMEAIRK
jgi:predicted SAM-dependent methyltransferase